MSHPRRRLVVGERLEMRALMATISWNTTVAPNGGAFTTGSNWVGGVVPGINDDAIIPDLPGASPLITSSGTVAVKSVTTSESLTISGGTFAATSFTQQAGSFRMTGGVLANTRLTQGTLAVAGNATFNNVTIDVGTTLNVSASVALSLANTSFLVVNGTANLGSSTTLTLAQTTSIGNATQLIVGSGDDCLPMGRPSTPRATGPRRFLRELIPTVGSRQPTRPSPFRSPLMPMPISSLMIG